MNFHLANIGGTKGKPRLVLDLPHKNKVVPTTSNIHNISSL